MKYKIITGLILIVFSSIGFTQKEQPYPPLYLVSAPTAGTLPKGTFTSEFLLQKNGGILPKIEIGLTNHFMIGLSYGMHKFIGDEKMNVNKTYPEVQIKYRAYEETTQWPAVVVGWIHRGEGNTMSIPLKKIQNLNWLKDTTGKHGGHLLSPAKTGMP